MNFIARQVIIYFVMWISVFYDFAKTLLIVGVTPLFDEMSDIIAEFATEIIVARIGEEAARICEHPDETGEQSVRGKLLELIHHSFVMVIEPPGSAKLDFAFFAILKAVHKAPKSRMAVSLWIGRTDFGD